MKRGEQIWVVHHIDDLLAGLCPNVFDAPGYPMACCCLTPDQVAAIDARLERERQRQRKPAA